MHKGRKPITPSDALARGTFRPDRHGQFVEAVAPRDPPIAPDWLTEAGKRVWAKELPHVVKTGAACELDSTAFANLCNLLGALSLAWQAGDVPPTSAVREARLQCEMFGLNGVLSRLDRKPTRGAL